MDQKAQKICSKIMNAWKDERDLRIKYEARSSIKAFKIVIKEFKSKVKLKLKT